VHYHIEGLVSNDLPQPIICIFDNNFIVIPDDDALFNDNRTSTSSFTNELGGRNTGSTVSGLDDSSSTIWE
jgi:hypothetical protein